MRPARFSPRRAPDRSTLWAVLALGCGLLLVGLFLGVKFWAQAQRSAIDETSLCPQAGPAAVTAVLVDRSDPLGPQQAQRVHQLLEQVIAEAPVGGKVALYLAEADAFLALSPVLALCNPGREANPIYQNPKRMRERYEKEFKSRFDAVRESLLQSSPRKTSPIMESIKAVCIDAFGAIPRGVPLRLVVISDFLQHSAVTSHYRERKFESFLNDPRLASVMVDCKGAEVDMIYLLRITKDGRPTIQNRAHQRFWELYFQRMKARPKSLEAV